LSAPTFAQQPRIDSIYIDESKGVLMVHGAFNNPSAANVFLDTVQLPIVSFSDTLLGANIPVSGPGSCGPVKVMINGKESNQRLITYWHIWVSANFVHSYSDGGFEYSGENDSIYVRCDINTFKSGALYCSRKSSFQSVADGN